MNSKFYHPVRVTLPIISVFSIWGILASGAANAASSTAAPAAGPANPTTGANSDDIGSAGERVNVENIKQKYWARGDESELGVVQNRLYTKSKKFEFGVFGGFVTTDPFLNVNNVGALLGYHFNEYIGLSVVGFKDLVRPSSALDYLRNPYPVGLGSDNSTNEPRWYLGSELSASIIYGKLSVIGKAIIHYDLHFLGGLGVTSTESGNNITPTVGIGQQFYITRSASLRVDYRLMHYNEMILQKVGSLSSPNGTQLGSRSNWTNSITIGVHFLIDPFGKKEATETPQ